MQETRIIVVRAARLLGDLIENMIGEHPDMTLVSRMESEKDLARHAKRLRADVVILNLETQALEEVCDSLLRALPDLAVISLSNNERSLLRCEMRPQVIELGEASVDRLIDSIRRSMRNSLH